MKCYICDTDLGDSFAINPDTLKAEPCGACLEAAAECFAGMDEEHVHSDLEEGFGEWPLPNFMKVKINV